MRQRRVPIAVAPPAQLQVQGREAFGPRVLLLEWHLQALGAPGRAPYEGEEQRVGVPGEEDARSLEPEGLEREGDDPALRLPEAARAFFAPYHLTRGDDVCVPGLHGPLPLPQPQRSATPFEVREREIVVGMCLPRLQPTPVTPTAGETPHAHRPRPRHRLLG